MADIFISYASDDREHAARLAAALAQRGWTIWWDRQLRTGIDYVRAIEEQLDSARCVVVLWSAKSKDSRWVRDEADSALRRGVLIPVAIEDVLPPMGMRGLQTARLIDWDGSADAPAFLGIANDIDALLGSGKTAKTAARRPRAKPAEGAAAVTDQPTTPAAAGSGSGKVVGVGLAVAAVVAAATYFALRSDPAPTAVQAPAPRSVAAAVPASAAVAASASVAKRTLEELTSRVDIEQAQCTRLPTGTRQLMMSVSGKASGPRGAWVSLHALSMGTTVSCEQWRGGVPQGYAGCTRMADDGKVTRFDIQAQPAFVLGASASSVRRFNLSVIVRYKDPTEAEPRIIARAETSVDCPR